MQTAVACEKVLENARPKDGERGIPGGPGEEDEVASSAMILQAVGTSNTPPSQLPSLSTTTASIAQLQQQLDMEEIPEDDPHTLPQVIVLYLVRFSFQSIFSL